MGKKTNKMYMTHKEWSTEFGGRTAATAAHTQTNTSLTATGHEKTEKLPFDSCALSLQPWQTPVCDKDGNIFELL